MENIIIILKYHSSRLTPSEKEREKGSNNSLPLNCPGSRCSPMHLLLPPSQLRVGRLPTTTRSVNQVALATHPGMPLPHQGWTKTLYLTQPTACAVWPFAGSLPPPVLESPLLPTFPGGPCMIQGHHLHCF